MFSLLSYLLVAFSLSQTANASPLPSAVRNEDEKLIFAFELVRHGARAPLDNSTIEKFTVGEGMLTPQGMRQRYLLGQHSR